MKLKLAMAAALLVSSSYASATVLVLDAGWTPDELGAIGDPTDLSPWTFTIASTSTLTIVDCCIAGDIWTLSGDVAGASSFYVGTADVRADASSAGFAWLDLDLSKFSTVLGPGSYSFSLTGNGAGGVPAGVNLRLDSGDLNGAVPEPATWAMMLLGFGFIGGALRSAKVRQRLTVSYG